MQFHFSQYLFLILILINPSLVSAEMYKWIDDEGRVHYGDKPNGKTTVIQVKPIQQYQSRSFQSSKTTKSKSKKSSNLINDLGFQEKFENMSDDDISQYHANLLRKEEEIKQGILLQMEDDDVRHEKQAKERQRKFEGLQKEYSQIKDNSYDVKPADEERLKAIVKKNKKARIVAKKKRKKEKRSLRRNPYGGGSMRYN